MPDDPDETDTPAEDQTSGGETNSTSTRYRYTNDVLAGALIAFAIVATGAYIFRGAEVPIWLASVDALAITTAVVWAFGRGAFSAASKAIAKDK